MVDNFASVAYQSRVGFREDYGLFHVHRICGKSQSLNTFFGMFFVIHALAHNIFWGVGDWWEKIHFPLRDEASLAIFFAYYIWRLGQKFFQDGA